MEQLTLSCEHHGDLGVISTEHAMTRSGLYVVPFLRAVTRQALLHHIETHQNGKSCNGVRMETPFTTINFPVVNQRSKFVIGALWKNNGDEEDVDLGRRYTTFDQELQRFGFLALASAHPVTSLTHVDGKRCAAVTITEQIVLPESTPDEPILASVPSSIIVVRFMHNYSGFDLPATFAPVNAAAAVKKDE